MSKPLTTIQREKMFQAWVEDQRIEYVLNTCSVSRKTVEKYRKIDNWDARLKEVRAKATEILDDDEAKYHAEQIKIIKNVKNVYLTCLIGKTQCPHCKGAVPVPKLKPNYADIEKIIRLEEFMRGKPDSRPDLGRMYDQLSDEQLDQLCQQSIDEICDRLRAISNMRKMADIKNAISGMLNELG